MIRPARNKTFTPKLQLFKFHDFELFDAGGWLIDGILQPSGLSLLYGQAGSRKTFLALDMALAVARGEPWRDRATRQAPVLYVACEAGRSFANRVVAYRVHHGLEDANVPFAAVMEPINLADEAGDIEVLIERANELSESFEAKVGLIQVDTLSRALNGADENSPADMGRIVANLDRIRSATGAHVLAVHHTGKDAGRGARGHSSLRAAVDTEIEVASDGDYSTAFIRKQRDMATTGGFAFNLEIVRIGESASHRPITSCVVCHAHDVDNSDRRRLTGQALKALDLLRCAIREDGKPLAADNQIPPTRMGIPIDLWREWFDRASAVQSDKQDSRRKAFQRAVQTLQKCGYVGVLDDWVWIVDR